jgi:hypothetical protein
MGLHRKSQSSYIHLVIFGPDGRAGQGLGLIFLPDYQARKGLGLGFMHRAMLGRTREMPRYRHR